jgi:hypothetical protein
MFPDNRQPPAWFRSGTDFPLAGWFVVQSTLKKEFQDEQAATGKHRRLPHIGDSGFRAIAGQFDDEFAHRGAASDQHPEPRFVVHNDAAVNIDAIDHPIDNIDAIDHPIDARRAGGRFQRPESAFERYRQPARACGKFHHEPVCTRCDHKPIAGAKQSSGGATRRIAGALPGPDQQSGSGEQPGPADPE